MDLRPYIGQKLELIFFASDCGQSTTGHFGYAYVVAECRPAKIDVQYCSSDKIARLSAPDGFVSYVWTDSAGNGVGSQQYIRLKEAKEGTVYYCRMKSSSGSYSNLSATIRRTTVNADFTCKLDTAGLKLHLENTSLVTGSKISRWNWEISGRDTGTLFVSGDSVVDCCIPDTGSYTVSLTAYAENGCAATRSVRLLVPVAAAVCVDSILVPRTPAHTGGSKIDPKVLISNRGNFDVAKVVVYAEVYGEDGVLLKRLSGQLQSLPKHSGKVFSFPNPYQVPMYGDTYRVKVFVDAVDFDADWSDDTLETVFGCRMDVTDFSLDSIVQPEHVPHLSGTSRRIQVGVSNRGSTDLRNVLLYAEVLDSGFTVIRRMQCYMDTLSSGRRRMVSFPSVYQVPDSDDIYLLRIYASRVQGDADASNDTLWEVFEILHDDAVEEYVGNGWQLGQNIPNPAAGRTLVPVTLPEAGAVRLQLFAADGRLLYRGELELPSGKSLLPLETGRYASGVYFYSVEYKGERKVRKMNVKP
ncbi:MAG: T9SS type A sorting domain-containing protein [Bacteroidales bacterium]|nr:T9SS type A sorting domain-containing protein [Bacteroidales bacterium]